MMTYYYSCSGKEKATEYYIANKEVLKENAKNQYRSLSEEEKEAKENMDQVDIETWQKIKKQAERVSKTISSSKKVKY